MSKRTSVAVKAGQLEGAKIAIETVLNDGLHESVTIMNRGSVVQPISGWVLASLRGQVFYQFPEDVLIRPGKNIVVSSGMPRSENVNNEQSATIDLFWANGQVWNNHSDTAILFDANNQEIDRYSYPHERVMGSSNKRQKVLIRNDSGFEIVDEGRG